ncbi:hypothetical protein CQI86_005013, partial [Escherichia coli O157:H7]|nr:hypothetical protein [Escherichia coli O157:H7]
MGTYVTNTGLMATYGGQFTLTEILRNYKAVINARRREMGQKPLTTAQIVDEICDFVANQQAVFLGGH